MENHPLRLVVSWAALSQKVRRFLGTRAISAETASSPNECADCTLESRWAPVLESLFAGSPPEDPLALCFEGASPESTLDWLREFLESRNTPQSLWCTVSEVEIEPWNRGWLGQSQDGAEEECFDRLVQAVEHSDLVLLVSEVPPSTKDAARAVKFVQILRPDAEVVFLNGEKASSEWHLRPVFSWDRTSQGCAWRVATKEPTDGAFVYRRDRPFHPEKLAGFLDKNSWLGYRAIGTLWLLTRPELAVFASRTGLATLMLEPEGLWIATLPPAERAFAIAKHPEIAAKWDRKHGDRQTELVFLGLNAQSRRRITDQLDKCLSTEWEQAAFAHGRLNVKDPLTGDWGGFNEGDEDDVTIPSS